MKVEQTVAQHRDLRATLYFVENIQDILYF